MQEGILNATEEKKKIPYSNSGIYAMMKKKFQAHSNGGRTCGNGNGIFWF